MNNSFNWTNIHNYLDNIFTRLWEEVSYYGHLCGDVHGAVSTITRSVSSYVVAGKTCDHVSY